MFQGVDQKNDAYIILPMVAGSAALIFDGGEVISPLHHYWFCFWVPTLLLLSQPGTGRYFSGVSERLIQVASAAHKKTVKK